MNGFTFVEEQGRHFGVPARDITQAEFEAMTPDQQRIVRESPAYKGKGGRPAAEPDAYTPQSAAKTSDSKEGS